MPDQLMDCARKAAKEIRKLTGECVAAHYGEKCEGCDGPKCTPSIDDAAAIIGQYMRKLLKEAAP